MTENRPDAIQDDVPLNLRLQRSPAATSTWTPSGQPLQLLGLVVSFVVLVAASKRRGRYLVPVAASLAAGSLAALATAILSRRRRAAREAVIDEQVEQSFPASDAPSV